jgi:hypothetical protein
LAAIFDCAVEDEMSSASSFRLWGDALQIDFNVGGSRPAGRVTFVSQQK